ncbi:MAG: site-2 protease family protein [Calditrichales bacterium]|nr:MAG: site-2 protease family protein [Calditrichales bacterium]
MKTARTIAFAEKIINGKMELDYFSKFHNTVIFRQARSRISIQEIDQIQATLYHNGIISQVQETSGDYLLRLLLDYSKVKQEDRRINLALFIVTIFTTTLTGAMLSGNNPFLTIPEFLSGLPYSFAVLGILGAHEMGHYLYAQKYRINTTLPYFIPFFLPAFTFGTFGAFIKMRSPIPNKKALLDVGIAGPIAGFIVSLVFLIVGFLMLPDAEGVREYITQIHEWSDYGVGALTLGNSLLFEFIRASMGAGHLPMYEIYHYPFIFAGWIGLLVTALNLLPIGQLDGGHISYALLGKKAKYVAIGAFVALALLNFYSTNWILWTIMILLIIRLKHPPTMDDRIKLDPPREWLAWASYIIFITCFSPMPIYIG